MRRARAWPWVALGGCLLLAAGLRTWHLTTLPPGYWYDEAHKSLVALDLHTGRPRWSYRVQGHDPWMRGAEDYRPR